MRLILFALLAFLADGPKPLQLRVRPTLAFAPSSLSVEIRVQPIASDRVLLVTADNGEDFLRSSGWTLEGANGPKLYSWFWRDVPAGEYAIVAGIGNGREWRATARQTVTLLSGGH